MDVRNSGHGAAADSGGRAGAIPHEPPVPWAERRLLVGVRRAQPPRAAISGSQSHGGHGWDPMAGALLVQRSPERSPSWWRAVSSVAALGGPRGQRGREGGAGSRGRERRPGGDLRNGLLHGLLHGRLPVAASSPGRLAIPQPARDGQPGLDLAASPWGTRSRMAGPPLRRIPPRRGLDAPDPRGTVWAT